MSPPGAPMLRRNRRITTPASLALALAAPLFAHDDDPKILDREPPYVGLGFRLGGAPPGARTLAGGAFASDGVTLLSWLTLAELDGGESGADCWGYVSPTGREYAIIGTFNGTSFVEITDPTNPSIAGFVDGPDSLWRDVKVYRDHAYAVSEGGWGIQVIWLGQIDSGSVSLVRTVSDPDVAWTHNVAIDEVSGFLYRAGGGDNGLRIYSLADPANPAYVASWTSRYVHDAQVVTYTTGPYAGRQIAYCCSGFDRGWTQTGLDVLDVTDKSSILQLDRHFYPNPGYSHQGWLSADRRYFYLGDETDEAGGLPTTTHILDVSDPTAVVGRGTFTNGNSATGHNLYTKGAFVYEANYRSGLRVFDANDPRAPFEVGYFDTYPDSDDAGYAGLWSVFPYFPSGVVIGSDMQRGLFVWSVPSCSIRSYCTGAPSSVGPGSRLLTTGSASIAANDLELVATQCPPGQPGIFFMGSTQLEVPFGNGFLCAGGEIRRFHPPVLTDASGQARRVVDLTAPPAAGRIVSDSTWNFQYWYRDPDHGGAFFNLSDGVEATFCP